jgi:hypothetical protein
MAEKEYQRLTYPRMRRTGLVTAIATRSSLWLGGDHLLCLDSTGYTEEYKRFYFRDIQAVVLRRTNRQRIFNFLFGGGALFFILLTLLVVGPPGTWDSDELPGAIVLLSGAAFFGALALVNTLKGPGCTCDLRTAVQTERLPSLNRLGRARRVLNLLRPLIEEAQGRLSAEEIATQLASPAAADVPPVIARHRSAPTPAPPSPYSGNAHLILSWVLLADVPFSAAYILLHSQWLELMSVLLLLGTVGCVIVALIKQHNSTLPPALKRLPWLVLGWTALLVMAAIVYGIFLVLNDPTAADRNLSPLDDPVVLVMTVASSLVSACFGLVGLKLVREARRTMTPPLLSARQDAPGA